MRLLLERLNIRTKMALVAALAVLMAALPQGLLLQKDWQRWSQARSEAAALPAVQGLMQLMRLTQQHRGLANGFLSGNNAAAADREAAALALQAQQGVQVFGRLGERILGVGDERLGPGEVALEALA